LKVKNLPWCLFCFIFEVKTKSKLGLVQIITMNTRYLPINNQLFTSNRQRLNANLLPNSMVLVSANDILPTNADGTFRLKQNSDFFYLTGIDQEESLLLLYPDCPNPMYREVLFLKETNDHIAVWEGYKYTKTHATEVSGISSVFWISQFDTVFKAISFEAEHIYLNANEHYRSSKEIITREERFNRQIQERLPLHSIKRLAPIMHKLRAIKSEFEIDLIAKACNITELGFRRLLQFIKPGVTEYEIEAELIHEFIKNRSQGFAYTPIIASGANACVLHYIENNRVCKDGDVILLDVAAEYGNYNSDLTRSIPVNGKFSPRQKQVYQSVLSVMKQATALLKIGNIWDEYHVQVGEIMQEELVNLGLISLNDIKNQNPAWPAYKKYFMHGTSHYLGLDVHDVGSRYRRFEAGMVFTCEPGIYIPEEGLGIRLENNILITENGNLDLMANIPIEIEEIEQLMNS
jgi:Xaa-Pro aminopeptidase